MPEPVTTLTLGSGVAALASALGAVPFSRQHDRRPRLVGLADAAAAGLMLGAGYLLMTRGIAITGLWTVVGGGVGVAYTSWVQTAARTNSPLASKPRSPVLRQTLHSASEGVAIAVAWRVDPGLGLFVISALALHNVAEGVVLTSALHQVGVSRPRSAALCVLAKSAQPILAIGLFVLLTRWPLPPSVLSAALGFAAGAMVFLLLTELLPESYRLTDHRAIASLVTVAAGAVLFLEDFFS